jgi:hypothetical protein
MKHGSVPTDIRGASRLAVDITMRVTTLVETMHRNIARRSPLLGRVPDWEQRDTLVAALNGDARRTLDFAASHRFIAYDTGHLDLLSSAAVCARMERWLGALPAAPFSRSAAASA